MHGGGGLGWDAGDAALVYSAFAWGALPATLPMAWLLQHAGTRRLLTGAGLLSALATLASPLAAYQVSPFHAQGSPSMASLAESPPLRLLPRPARVQLQRPAVRRRRHHGSLGQSEGNRSPLPKSYAELVGLV